MSFPRKVIKHVLMVALWVTPCTLPVYASDASEKENKARLTIHNVGVGQCYDLEIYDAASKSTKNILIGYGIEELKSLPNTYDSLDPVSKVNISASDYRPSPLVTPLSSEELIRELRRKFRRKDEVGDVIDVDAVVLTHPLKDSGLVMDLFRHEADHLRHLYLTGLPENYYADKSGHFWSWLKEKEMRKTHIHFLALKKFTVDSLYKDEIRPYTINYFTRSVKRGEEVFNFADVKVSLLSVNPTHFAGYHDNILRSSLPEDLHSDSLLLKIICGENSIILSGSATSLTTNRAIDNYRNDPKALQASVLIASQYGSTLQGANNKEWLEKVNPEYVIISHGSSQATFDQTLYDSLKSLKSLKDSLPPHEIEVQIPEEHVSTIQQGIFSTLKSGTITIDLYKKGLKIRTEKEGEISQSGVKDPLKKQESVLIRRPYHHSHSRLFSASSSPSVKSSPKMVSRQRERDGFSDRDSAASSPQTEKSQRKNLPRDLPRTQSLSPTKEKDSARKKLHEKTPEHKKEKPFFHHIEKSEFESDESSSRFNKLERSDRKKAVSEKKHRTNTLSSPRGKITFVRNKHHELTSGSQRNEKHLSPKTETRKKAKEFVSEESSRRFKRLDLSESDEGSSGKGKDKTKEGSSFNETEEKDDSTEESRENKSFSDES